jgi:hypothetical protein
MKLLSPAVAHEYELLLIAEPQIVGALSQIEPDDRLSAYRYIVRRTWVQNTLHLPPIVEVRQAVAAERLLAEEVQHPMKTAVPAIDPVQVAPTPEPVDLWQADDIEAQAIEVAIEVAAVPTDAVPQWKPAPAAKPKPQGCRVLDEVVASTRSTVFASATGTGKSVSQSYILTQLAARFPDADAWAIGQKNDSYCGLREAGRSRVFDALNPEEAFDVLDIVWDEFDRRKNAPEDERGAFKEKPVRLILSDWHSIWGAIKDGRFYKDVVQPKLSTIVTVGREMNVCLIVDTQSYNVKSLGLAEDANIRANLNILCQGYVWQDEEGIDRGDYAMIENLLKNRYLVQDATLAQNFDRLVAESQKQQTPIIFTTIGRQPRLELLPDLRKYKQQVQEFKQAPAPVVTTSAKTTVDDTAGAFMVWARSLDHLPADDEVAAWYADRKAPTAQPGTCTLDLLLDWIKEMHRLPTETELRQKYQQLTGEKPNDQVLAVLKSAIYDEEEIIP